MDETHSYGDGVVQILRISVILSRRASQDLMEERSWAHFARGGLYRRYKVTAPGLDPGVRSL